MAIARINSDLISNNFKLNLKKWWVEINTTVPNCTYYFGPFTCFEEAVEYRDGYIEDLIEEGANGITVNIKKQFQPQLLTLEVF